MAVPETFYLQRVAQNSELVHLGKTLLLQGEGAAALGSRRGWKQEGGEKRVAAEVATRFG